MNNTANKTRPKVTNAGMVGLTLMPQMRGRNGESDYGRSAGGFQTVKSAPENNRSAILLVLTRFLDANRSPPRIKCGAGFRLKTLYPNSVGCWRPARSWASTVATAVMLN